MPRLMYDSVNPFAIPDHAQMVLVYVDGIYKWSQAGRDRFKHAQQVTCSAIGAVTAQVGDVEAGCIWPVENAVPWVQRARRDGYDPTIYINQMNDWGPCRRAFQRAGVPEPHWLVANYDGVPEIPDGSIGKQYAHPSTPLGNPLDKPWHTTGHWDESWVADYWPGVDEHPPGGGATTEELNVGTHLLRGRDTGRIYVVTITSVTRSKWWVPNVEVADVVAGLMGTTARDVDDWRLDYIADEPGAQVPDVDEAAITGPLIAAVLGALKDVPADGLTFEETVGAVREALRRGTGA
ncbi:hypothetical protein [Lentzea sp. NPDC059081]|uniref:hypothetical protein n=1 Tax=Lentzea sp. NPDC059081 TaxID=3346719 RepID=UPI003689F114